MNRFLLLTAMLCLTVSGVRAQTAAAPAKPVAKPAITPLPADSELTAAKVLDGYVEATGGAKTREGITSMRVSLSLELVGQDIAGTGVLQAKAPNKAYVRTEIGAMGMVAEQGFDGEIGWSADPFGRRRMAGTELANFKFGTRFDADVKWRDVYAKVELLGTADLDGRAAWVIALTPKEEGATPLTCYYDTQSNLMLRYDSVQASPLGQFTIVSLMKDYRKAGDDKLGGFLMPFRMEQHFSLGQMAMTFDKVELNVEIDDALFEMPKPAETP